MCPSKHRTTAAAALLTLVTGGLLGGCAGTHDLPHTRAALPRVATSTTATATALADLEHRFHARLGLFALDTRTGRSVTYRADEHFAFCSTGKVLAAAILLRDDSDARLDQVITYRSSDIVEHSPVTSKHVATGMTSREIIAAALRYSDNTAENLMLTRLGGPAALQAALRRLGDTTTNVDRDEPALDDVIPGDTRDTSTPRTLATDLRGFVLGAILPTNRRDQLTSLMLGNTTGAPYIKAGLPAGWKVADKTGSGDHGTRDDIAVVVPPGGAPIVIAVLSDRDSANASSDDALIADATRTAIAALR